MYYFGFDPQTAKGKRCEICGIEHFEEGELCHRCEAYESEEGE